MFSLLRFSLLFLIALTGEPAGAELRIGVIERSSIPVEEIRKALEESQVSAEVLPVIVGKPTEVEVAAKTLLFEKKIHLLVGPSSFNFAQSLFEFSNTHKLPTILLATFPKKRQDSLVKDYQWLLGFNALPDEQIQLAVDVIKERRLVRKVVGLINPFEPFERVVKDAAQAAGLSYKSASLKARPELEQFTQQKDIELFTGFLGMKEALEMRSAWIDSGDQRPFIVFSHPAVETRAYAVGNVIVRTIKAVGTQTDAESLITAIRGDPRYGVGLGTLMMPWSISAANVSSSEAYQKKLEQLRKARAAQEKTGPAATDTRECSPCKNGSDQCIECPKDRCNKEGEGKKCTPKCQP